VLAATGMHCAGKQNNSHDQKLVGNNIWRFSAQTMVVTRSRVAKNNSF